MTGRGQGLATEVAHARDERLGPVGAGLEERAGADPQPVTVHDLVEPRRLVVVDVVRADHHDVGRHFDTGRRRCREDEPLARGRPRSDGDLVDRAAVTTTEPTVADELVHQGMGDEAAVHVDDVVGARGPEPEPTVDDRASDRGAVARGGQGRAEVHQVLRGSDAADAPQRIDDDGSLQRRLGLGAEVLEVAAPAPPVHVRARRVDPIG